MSTAMSETAQSVNTLMHMTVGFWISQAIYAAARLGIADHLQSGPKSVSQLAQTLKAQQDNLARLLRALVGIGLFQENPDGTYALTPMSHLLCTDHPDSMLPAILMLGDENYRAWNHLPEAILNGGVPFEKAYGLQAYEYYKQNPAEGKRFNDAMAALNRQDLVAIAEVYDFGVFNTLADIGGGNGALLTAILKRYPNLSGILFELPQVQDEAINFLQKEGLESRCRFLAGDFFQAVDLKADAYILAHIMHTFSDELCLKILQNIHRTMPENGKLLIVEEILTPGSDPATAKTKFMDLNMLVLTEGGREHTMEEFEALFRNAGFTLTNMKVTGSGTAIIEAVKAK